MRRLALAVTVSAVISVGCRDQQPVQPTASAGPEFMISDGAHNGNTHFFFLPPLAADPSALFHAGTFNSKLAPVVEVCVLTGDPSSGSPVDCMTSGGAPVLVFGPAPMALDATDQLYARNWDTKSPTPLDPSKFYRILVRGARSGTALGFLDVDPVDQGVKNVRTGDVVQFQDGRTLPIKVRIEDGAFGATNPDHVEQVVGDVATTVTTNTGFAGASFPDGWLPQAARDAGINQVVLIIERIPVGSGTTNPTCLQSGLLEREGCYRFRTDPDLHAFGPFSQLVTAGVCPESPELIGKPNAPPLELHRRVEVEGAPAGPTIDLVEVAAPFLTCASFGPTPPSIGTIKSGSVLELASLGWHALVRGIGRLVTPEALHAFDLGAGGSTDGFSRIGWARHVTMTKVSGTDGNSAIAGTTLTPDPAVCLTLVHHGVSSPLGSAPVTFTVAGGGGTVGGGNNVTVNTGTDGCAHAPWVLGTTPGPNTLTAAALASGSPLTFTATGTRGNSFSQLDAGTEHTCALRSDGVVECWGRNDFGEAPATRTATTGSFTQVSAGALHTCALRSDDVVECWGYNVAGEAPATRTAATGGFTQVSGGGFHTCALRSDGVVECWGFNGDGAAPATRTAATGGFTQVSTGDDHTCALRSDGVVECWGAGATNTGTFPDFGQAPPTKTAATGSFTAVSDGQFHTCALRSDGVVECWGAGATNTGTFPDFGQAPATRTAATGSFNQVSGGGHHTCALRSDGVVECWGDNSLGQAPATRTASGGP